MRWNAAASRPEATWWWPRLPRFHRLRTEIQGADLGRLGRPRLRRRDARYGPAEKLPSSIPVITARLAPASAGTWWTGLRATPIASSAWSPTTASFDLVSEYGSTEELWFRMGVPRPALGEPGAVRRLSPSSYVQNFRPDAGGPGELDSGTRRAGPGKFTALQRAAGSNRGCSTSPTRGTGSSSRGTASSGTHGARLECAHAGREITGLRP